MQRQDGTFVILQKQLIAFELNARVLSMEKYYTELGAWVVYAPPSPSVCSFMTVLQMSFFATDLQTDNVKGLSRPVLDARNIWSQLGNYGLRLWYVLMHVKQDAVDVGMRETIRSHVERIRVTFNAHAAGDCGFWYPASHMPRQWVGEDNGQCWERISGQLRANGL